MDLARARIGIFGGSFNPPHLGHLILAEAARAALGLSQLLWLPAAQPPHKQGQPIAPTHHRVAMTGLAIASNPAFELCLLDAERQGPTYTVETMRHLQAQAGEAVDFFFLIGMDSLVDLPTWHQAAELVKRVHFGVAARPGFRVDWATLAPRLPGLRERVHEVPVPLIGISSTMIRERVRQGETIRYLLPGPVAEYILEHELYQR